jgi:hypothetical protein
LLANRKGDEADHIGTHGAMGHEVVSLIHLAGTRVQEHSVAFLHSPSVVLFVFLFFVVVPVVQILRRRGHNPVWRLLALAPSLNFLAFWFFAFKPWPTDKKSANIGN